MSKNLVIVESPAKAKTIENFLGKDFTVKSCNGHVRDLAKKDFGIDIENGFNPIYEVSDDKKTLITELKKLAKKSEVVWLASDEDREGEAISWHLVEALKLDESKIKRIVFHEITKDAILNAINNPRDINVDLVNAQQARRVLDRLVGFELSPVLWKKVKPSLSAGRVQSVAVRLIVEKENDIKKFKTKDFYKVTATFISDGKAIKAELSHKFDSKAEAEDFLNKCSKSDFKIENIDVKPVKKSPAAPFTTSTLQQEASIKLGYSVSQTMRVAQQLYEAGHITYMRTDSMNLSKLAISTSKNEIIESYGEEYSKTRNFATKSKGAQEAHEAIRPTYMQNHTIDAERAQVRLYELIWKRTIASQMSEALLEKTIAKIGISEVPEYKFVANGEVLKFEGFLKVYLESKEDDEDEETSGILPPLKVGENLNYDEIYAVQRFSKHPARFTEASLVRKLEELGIGRPSTYAPTISTIQKRQYVEKTTKEGKERLYNIINLNDGKVSVEEKTEIHGREKSKLFPTDIGTVVNDFLVDHFDTVMDYHFTANVESQFDEIANGGMIWNNMIDKFYEKFHPKVEHTLEHSERASGERILGKDPKSGEQISVRIGRYGAMAQLGEGTEEEKPKFASLRVGQSISDITLEEALDLFKLPRDLGLYEDKKVVVGVGRFGPYVRHDGKFVSIPKPDDPLAIGLDRGIELIEEKRKKDREKLIKSFDNDEKVQVLNGRFGPYIAIEKKNFKIPKTQDPKELTLEECYKIAEEASKPKPKKKAKAKTKAKTKAKKK